MKWLHTLADRQTKLLHFPTHQHLKDEMDQSVGASKLSDDNLGNRTDRFKDIESELEQCCVAKAVEYIPPSAAEVWHKTRSRRRKLEEQCDPGKKEAKACKAKSQKCCAHPAEA